MEQDSQVKKQMNWLQLPSLLLTDAETPHFGFSDKVKPAQPMSPSFLPAQWPLEDVFSRQHPESTSLAPYPSLPPPQKPYRYPQSCTWQLIPCLDRRYLTGWFFTAPFNTSEVIPHERDSILKTIMPPRPIPIGPFCLQQPDKLPGMVRLRAGYPFAQVVDGNELQTITVACCHTLSSLESYSDYSAIKSLADRLCMLSWEGLPSEGIPPIYAIPGLGLNERTGQGLKDRHESDRVGPSELVTVDGSYSFASTVEEGNGRGIFKPSKQAETKIASFLRAEVLTILHGFYRHIMPKSISKEEWDCIEFHSLDNNILGFGGLEPNNTSVQMNVSSECSGGDLSRSIGRKQGSFHVDGKDDHARWTMFVLLYRLPPGSDPGPFLLGRYGLYIHELNCAILWLVFKGGDLHGGYAPYCDPEVLKTWEQSISSDFTRKFGTVKRIGYVCYPSKVACRRESGMSVTPALGFGNASSVLPKAESRLTFAQHGRTIFANARAFHNLMARESLYALYNTMSLMRISCDLDLMWSSHKYEDEAGVQQSLEPLPFHPERDAAQIQTMRSRYKRHENLADRHHMHLSRDNVASAHHRLAKTPANEKTPSTDILVAHKDKRVTLTIFTGVSSSQGKEITSPLSVVSPLSSPPTSPLPSSLSGQPTRLPSLPSTSTSTSTARDAPAMVPHSSVALTARDSMSASNTTVATAPLAQSEVSVPMRRSKRRRPSEITCIVAYQNGKYNVQWSAGSSESNKDWVTDAELRRCATYDTIATFIKTQNVSNKGSDRSDMINDEEESDGSEDDENSLPEVLVEAPRRKTGQPLLLATSPKKIDALANIFNPQAIQELHDMIKRCCCTVEAEASIADTNTLSVVLSSQSNLHSELSKLTCKGWDGPSSFLVFRLLDQSLGHLSTMVAGHARTHLYRLALNLELRRTLVIIYRWWVDVGPDLASCLVSYRSQRGPEEMAKEFPEFSQLIESVWKFAERTTGLNIAMPKPVQKKQRKAHTSVPQLLIPANLFGLQANNDGTLVDMTPSTQQPGGRKSIQELAEECFLQLMSERVILPRLSPIDAYLNGPRRHQRSNSVAAESLKHRSIVRGAILQTLLDICGGDDSLFASDMLDDVLKSPASYFKSDKDLTLARAILQDAETALAELYGTLTRQRDHNEGFAEAHSALGVQLWDAIKLLKLDATIPRQGPLPLLKKVGKKARTAKPKRTVDALLPLPNTPAPSGPLAVHTLVHIPHAPFMTHIALILRDTLNLRYGRTAADPYISRILKGLPITEGFTQKNPDFFDPVRGDNRYARQLHSALPPAFLTTGNGISCLASYMSAGLNSTNAEFVQNTDMQFSSLEECAAAFALSLHKHDQASPTSRVAPCENPNCWGNNACNNFFIRASIKRKSGLVTLTPETKFEPYWTNQFQSSYLTLIGDLANQQDVLAYTGHRCSWNEMQAWIVSQDVPIFRNGLTLMQFTNNLALSGICEKPTIAEMSSWISKNRKLGAYYGLLILGFNLQHGTQEWIQSAFTALYSHLDQHLSAVDKATLRFDVIFVEHILCKITRYGRAFIKKMPQTFHQYSEVLRESESITTSTGAAKFPIPLVMSPQCLAESLQ